MFGLLGPGREEREVPETLTSLLRLLGCAAILTNHDRITQVRTVVWQTGPRRGEVPISRVG